MNPKISKKIRKLNLDWHRDLGYLFSALIIIYCISGIALNHINDWDPDFIIEKKEILIQKKLKIEDVNKQKIDSFGKLVGESSYKLYDFPTKDQLKIYYNDASLHINFSTKKGVYESVYRRPLFYQVNVIHKNSLQGWRWFSDIFAGFLIVITVTGMFIAKGGKGIKGRGKWLLLAGTIIPIIAIIIHAMK